MLSQQDNASMDPTLIPFVIRRLIPLIIVLFNFILFILAAVDLTHGRQFSLTPSYVSATDLLCITSALTCAIVSLMCFLNYRDPGWMPYSISFEYAWVGVILIFQFISAVVLSSEPTTMLCRTRRYYDTDKQMSVCPVNSAALGFVWTCFLLLIIHLTALTLHVHILTQTSHTTFLRILQTPHEDLVLFTSNPNHTNNQFTLDLEKSRSVSPNGGLGGKRKGPPRPLDLSKISSNPGSTISLPIYRTFASTNPGAARQQQQQQQQPKPTKPNRHQLMAAALAAADDQAHHHPYAANNTDNDSHLHTLNNNDDSPNSSYSPPLPPDSTISWTAPDSWAVHVHVPIIPNDDDDPTTAIITKHHHHRPQSKQLPPLPPLRLPTHPPNVSFKLGGRSEGGVVDRPDPRDRKPPRVGEVKAEGGFWITKATHAQAQAQLGKAGWI